MSTAQYEIKISDGFGDFIPFALARDPQTNLPLFKTSVENPLRLSYQAGEASYASHDPRVSAVYVQADLSDGLGIKTQRASLDEFSKRYYYAEWLDASVAGQIQKGPAISLLTVPANSGPLNGFFTLGGTPYPVLSRIVTSWASDTLTSVEDLGAGVVGSSGAMFLKLGTEASLEASTGTVATDTIVSADGRIAQQIRSTASGLRFISRVDATLISADATITGDVRMSIMADLDGKASNQILSSASILASTIATSLTSYSFRFNDDDAIAIAPNEPMWLVLDAAGATAAKTIGWRRSSTDTYTRGLSATSVDRGNKWTTSATQDYLFDLFVKAATATGFIGDDSATGNFFTTTDGLTFTADTYRSSAFFATVADRIVRDVRTQGAIQYSTDGANWSEPIPLGDVTRACTGLLVIGDTLVVTKTDSIWAVDITASPVELQEIYATATSVATNGQGACEWRGTAYIPFNGKLASLSGNFADGFVFDSSIGPESSPEWDSPWGQGRIVAVAGDRFHLYAFMSATGGYRLLKSAVPSTENWHGSLATIGDGTQDLHCAYVHDPGGTSSPHLFFQVSSTQLGRITLPRSANPASDPLYRYDITTTGNLFYPRSHGNFHVNPKAYLYEAVVFQSTASSDYVDILHDTVSDDEGFRIMEGGRLYETGIAPYPTGRNSLLLARRLDITNSAQTASPIILASALVFAVRPIADLGLRRLEFVIDVDDSLSSKALGDFLGMTGQSIEDVLWSLSINPGSRTVIDHRGHRYEGVVFLDTDDVVTSLRSGDTSDRARIKVSAVQVV